MNGLVRVIASFLIVFASGVIAPDVWTQNGTLSVAGQTTDVIRSVEASAQVATATTVTRFLLDSRVERERQTLPHVLVPSNTSAASPRIARLVPRESLHKQELFVLSLIRVRAPPQTLSLLNS